MGAFFGFAGFPFFSFFLLLLFFGFFVFLFPKEDHKQKDAQRDQNQNSGGIPEEHLGRKDQNDLVIVRVDIPVGLAGEDDLMELDEELVPVKDQTDADADDDGHGKRQRDLRPKGDVFLLRHDTARDQKHRGSDRQILEEHEDLLHVDEVRHGLLGRDHSVIREDQFLRSPEHVVIDQRVIVRLQFRRTVSAVSLDLEQIDEPVIQRLQRQHQKYGCRHQEHEQDHRHQRIKDDTENDVAHAAFFTVYGLQGIIPLYGAL